MYGNGVIKYRYLLEIWCEGELIHQRPLKQKIIKWNQSKHCNSLIFLLHKDDGGVDENTNKHFINILSMNEATKLT